MSVWCLALFLLCCTMNCMGLSAPSALYQRNKYNNSFRLTRSTRSQVQQLLREYKEHQLGNKHFEDRSQLLKELPLLSIDFNKWLQLTDSERLHAAFLDMQAYWSMLEWKRNQLEREEKGYPVAASVVQSIKHIQLDLRDLMSQVRSQMRYMKIAIKLTSPTVRPQLIPESSNKTVWDSRVEGYIILRDLDRYLTKLARDFLLLASKTQS
ncbi:uncharacterized protein KZ484_006583 [Pholidichthys leucotaenia]